MKLSKKITYLINILLVILLLPLQSCEGLDDWSDLKSIDLFNTKNTEGDQNTFKRYNEPGLSSQPIVESIYDSNSKFSRLYNSEIRKICDYTKIPFHNISMNSWNTSHTIMPSTRIIMVYDTKKLDNASVDKLLNFVSNGGTLFIPFASEDKRMSYLLGFKPQAEYATDIIAAGFYFKTPMLPNMKGRTYANNTKLFGFAGANFSNKIKVLATAANNQNYPTVIENKIGSGRVVLLNTSGDFSKIDRGFLFAGILKGLEGIPYPIANTSTIFLDDFPSPQYDIIAEPIKSEMNITTSDFVQKIWWTDMRALAKEFKIPYAAMLTFDYRNKIVPPFTLDQWNARKIKTANKVEPLPDWLVNDVAKNGHELAFHGYNHVSLTKELWKNLKFIPTSMNTVKKKWEISNYGKFPTTYVPPSNEIDKTGIVELKKAMPSIKYMCSLYLGLVKDGAGREFDYDPYEKNLFDYPRISSGFYFNDEEKFAIQSLYLYTGIWGHFVHPDDVYQIPATADKRAGGYGLRNRLNYGWRKTKGNDKAMFSEFKSYLKQQLFTYPQMRFVNGNDGGRIVIDWRASRYSYTSEGGYYSVKQTNADDNKKQYWFMYGSVENADKIESQLKNQMVLFTKSAFMDGNLYSVYSSKPNLKVIDLNYKNKKERLQQLAINQMVMADLANYKIEVSNFLKNGSYVDDSEKKLKLEIAALKQKMLSNAVIDSVTWNKYAKYMSWEDKGAEVWKMLEEHVAKYPSKGNIMYSKELDRIIGYTDDVSKEKWMYAQISVSPNDKELLYDYVNNFNTEENRDKIKGVLKALNKVDPSTKNYLAYLKHLLDYYPDEALVELKDKIPTNDFSELATQIVWLFADNAEYKKALEWSVIAKDIDFVNKMNWYIESGQSKLIEPEYLKYIADHPDDYTVKILMSTIYHQQGKFKEAWVIANGLPESDGKEELRKTLNKDVVYEEVPLQEDLIATQVALFYPDVLKKLKKTHRLATGNFVDLNSSLETNQDITSIQKNVFSYNFYDTKNNLHSVGATYSKYYKLQVTAKNYADNVDNNLKGLEYKFTTAQKEGKIQYWTRARAEIDQNENSYFQLGLGLNSANDKRYRSADLSVFPVETAPALNQKIYQIQLNVFQDFHLFKYINTSIAFEGNYYTDGLLSSDTIGPIINPNRMARFIYTTLENGGIQVDEFDSGYDGALTLRLMLNKGDIKKFKFIPFLESQAALGSRDLTKGYPYWIIKDRLYGGGGVGFEYGTANFNAKIEGGYFFDNFSTNFERLTTNLSYQLFDFTAITFNMEVFEQSKFYSNTVQFGIRHNFKKRYKKK